MTVSPARGCEWFVGFDWTENVPRSSDFIRSFHRRQLPIFFCLSIWTVYAIMMIVWWIILNKLIGNSKFWLQSEEDSGEGNRRSGIFTAWIQIVSRKRAMGKDWISRPTFRDRRYLIILIHTDETKYKSNYPCQGFSTCSRRFPYAAPFLLPLPNHPPLMVHVDPSWESLLSKMAANNPCTTRFITLFLVEIVHYNIINYFSSI